MPDIRILNNGNTISVNLAEGNDLWGYVTAVPDEDMFRITDFYVAKEHRNQGYGSMILNSLTDVVGDLIACDEIYATYTLSDKTRDFYDFLESAGFVENEDYQSDVYSFTLQDLSDNLKRFDNSPRISEFTRLEDCPSYVWHNLEAHVNTLTDPVVLREMADYDKEHSFFLIKDKAPLACCLVSHGADPSKTGINLDYLYNESGDPVELLTLIVCVYKGLTDSFPKETRIYTNAINPDVVRLLKKLCDVSLVLEGKAVLQSLVF
ncbi:MAG: GNAT family N-acetyltransferase [Lachnospiraceae bacterium]|nr:GNAT family N-acetyltransferase [Lachnospiraceae bacterium]